jgi:hypothetical protein
MTASEIPAGPRVVTGNYPTPFLSNVAGVRRRAQPSPGVPE